MLERKKILVDRVIHIVSDWLKENNLFSSPLVKCRQGKSGEGKLFINVTRISAGSLLIQEGYALSDGENRIHRSWSFLKEGAWDVAGLEKNGKPVVIRHLQQELDDLLHRLEVVGEVVCPIGCSYDEDMEDIGLDLWVPPEMRPESSLAKAYRNFVSWHGWRSPVFYAVTALLLCLFFGTVLMLIQFYGLKITQEFLVDNSIAKITDRISAKESSLDEWKNQYESQSIKMTELMAHFERDEEIFVQNSYAMVLQLEKELPSHNPLRKRAYRLIANNIAESCSNAEILFELNRLPRSEYQANIFLETNSESVVTLSSYKPIISSLLYPTVVAGRENDGKGFRITSGYMARRVDPLGGGGTYPHHAVDIMNVSNIRKINSDGSLDRAGMPNGNIVAVADGVVIASHKTPAFGYIIEIRHPLNPEIQEKFPEATGWRTYYAHMYAPSSFKVGDKVEAGEKIGEIGNSGTSSTGPHLHFEIRLDLRGAEGATNMQRVNPYPGSEEVDYF